jgi:alpha-N-arabinofuranosidase
MYRFIARTAFFMIIFVLWCNLSAQDKKEFTNPILAGFYPDPSICRVGSDYYLVNSTFSYFPGITIFHSRDLVNWKLIGHVLNRREQLNLDGQGVSRGIFAPAIRYHNGIYYVTCTLVDIGGNFIATSKSPEGPWSNPVWIPQINGIDPSMFFDESGKSYILYNSIAPDDKPLYDGHRTIRMYEFDLDSLKVRGNEKILVNGGTDLRRNPVWIEGPHLFLKDGYYYLIAAEGGTGDQHSEVVFRSKNCEGPYEAFAHNPILTQRQLNPKREFAITCTGHADFVQTERGAWWAVFLGCRPYPPVAEGYYNTGRETYLVPVKWEHGWPVVNSGKKAVHYHYPLPLPVNKADAERPYSGNFTWRDEFDKDTLSLDWTFLRTPQDQWYGLKKRKGSVALQLRRETCSGNMNPSFLGHRQQHLCGSVSSEIDFIPKAENEKAGLLVFQNETHFYFLCKSQEGNESVIQLFKSTEKTHAENSMELIASQKLGNGQQRQKVLLKIKASGNRYSFSYAFQPDRWFVLKDSVDARFLSTKVAGGFVGSMYALYATSLGMPSTSVSYFDWFEYQGNDEVYK